MYKRQIDGLFGLGRDAIENAALREVYEEIKNLRLHNFNIIGVINDDSSYLGLTHFAFVLEAELPNDFEIEEFNTELSINELRFLSKKEDVYKRQERK